MRAQAAHDPRLAEHIPAGPVTAVEMCAAAVALRDRGCVEVALELLRAGARAAPARPDFWIEVLVILLVNAPDVDAAIDVCEVLPSHLHAEPRLMMLRAVAQVSIASRRFSQAAAFMADAVESGPAPQFFTDLLESERVAAEAAGAEALQHLAEVASVRQHASLGRTRASAAMVKELAAAPTIGDFHAILSDAAFIRRRLLRPEWRAVADELAPSLKLERRVLLLALLCSLRDRDGAHAIWSSLPPLEGPGRAGAVKWLVFFAQTFGGDDAWARADAETLRYLDDHAGSGDAEYLAAPAQHLEVIGRALTMKGCAADAYRALRVLSPTPRPPPQGETHPHMFVGLFGQCRFPKIFLPRLFSFLESSLAGARARGVKISYGISTWSRSGVRAVSPQDSIAFLNERLPEAFVDLVENLSLVSVEDFRQFFPSTYSAFTLLHTPQAGSKADVNAAMLCELTTANLLCDISDDDIYLGGTGSLLSDEFGVNNVVLNQGRMWNRISGLRGLMRRAGELQSTPCTAAIALRTDLNFTGQTLASFLEEALESESSDRIWVDRDPYAYFLEGLGDRFIFGGYQAMERIFSGEQALREAIGLHSRNSSSYKSRFSGHQFLSTILFQENIIATEVGRDLVPFEIDRGRIDIALLRRHLLDDLSNLAVEPGTQLRLTVERFVSRLADLA